MSDRTITLQAFIQLLAAHVNCDEQIAADFIREFSSATAHGLATDGFVNINGLGSFRVVTDVDGSLAVEFAPAPSLASTVNEPFAIFEPVVLADAVTDEEVAEVEQPSPSEEPEEISQTAGNEEVEQVDSEPLPPPVPDRFRIKPEIEETEPANEPSDAEPVNTLIEAEPTHGEGAGQVAIEVGESEASVVVNAASSQEPKPSEVSHPSPVTQETPVCPENKAPRDPQLSQAPTHREGPLPVLLEPESHVTVKRVGHTTLTLLLAAAAALLLGICIGSIIGYNFRSSLSSGIVTYEEPPVSLFPGDGPPPQPKDSIGNDDELVDTLPPDTEVAEPEVVTDTVGPGNYLSIMAKRHYGNPKFWVYIYIENKDQIRNPDNLENGMVLVIPPAEKYGIDPDSKESLDRAQREATRIANQ